MKKYYKVKKMISLLMMIFIINMFIGCTSNAFSAKTVKNINIENTNINDEVRTLNYDEIKDSLIRFHVIANSDTTEDQDLKIKVKNNVIDYLYPYLNQSQSLTESREIIKEKMIEVKKLAEDVIKDNNYNYSVKVELSRENFPDKSYGNIVLPQGNYEAFRIIIGNGQGKNWWCVMFPPLCFVDESRAEVEYDKVQEKITSNKKKEMDFESDDLETKERKNNDCNDKQNNIKIKLKSIEILENLFK